MSSTIGKYVRLSLFGESHGPAVGMLIEGLDAGEKIDIDELNLFMAARRGGKSGATPRREDDTPVFISGLTDGRTNGAPLAAYIVNSCADSSAYESSPLRPGHADYTALVKWRGNADLAGGGHLSGRLTAPMCLAGGIAKQILARRGIRVCAHLLSCAGINDDSFELFPDESVFKKVDSAWPRCINEGAGKRMLERLNDLALSGDSAGGVAECAIIGLPAGLGSPIFEGIENRLASALFGIPAVKGVEFGSGFEGASSTGKVNNDPFETINGQVVCSTNNAGGILGGITNGMPVIVRAAFKPTPSISAPQRTLTRDFKPAAVSVHGRHDVCVALRGCVAAEAMCAFTVLDLLKEGV